MKGYAALLLVSIGAGALEAFNALSELDSVFRAPIEAIGLEDIGAILGRRMPDEVDAVHSDWLRKLE